MAEAQDAPSPFLLAQREALREAARLGPILDVACGRGRHALELARLGLPVVGLDRDRAALAEIRARAAAEGLRVGVARCDLESGSGLPVRAESCGAVLVFRFLHRPLCPDLAQALVPGGLLLYETFTSSQKELGRGPRNPAFLLELDELPALFPGLRAIAREEGLFPGSLGGSAQALARLAARRPQKEP